jgi:hypothetical protein
MEHVNTPINEIVVMYVSADQVIRPPSPPDLSVCKGIMSCFSLMFLNFTVWVTVRLCCPWKTTMTSGQDVSEYLDTLVLLNHIFQSCFRKKIKKIEKKNVLVLRRPRGSGHLSL